MAELSESVFSVPVDGIVNFKGPLSFSVMEFLEIPMPDITAFTVFLQLRCCHLY
jgi:hypothetical protein